MNIIKIVAIVGFILSLNACSDNNSTQNSTELVLSLNSLKNSLPQSLFNSKKLIYMNKEGKEVDIDIEYLEHTFSDKHPTGLSYKREEFTIILKNNILKINTTLNGSCQLAYGDVKNETYSISISDNNPSKDALKNTIILSYFDNTKLFFPDNFTSTSVSKEILFGSEFDNVMKSKALTNAEVGTRFSKQLGIISLVDYDNNMYIIKTK
jgi:hypothetical protein